MKKLKASLYRDKSSINGNDLLLLFIVFKLKPYYLTLGY